MMAKLPNMVGPDFNTIWASGITIGTKATTLDGAVVYAGTFPGSSGAGYRFQIAGVDSFTGKDVVASLVPIFGANATLSLYHIIDTSVADKATFDTRMKSLFQTSTDLNPLGRELYRELTLKTASPQINLIIDRPIAGAGLPPATDVPEFYLRQRVKVDANVNANLANGQYIQTSFYKTGGYAGNYYGDFRAKVEINKSGGVLFWRGGLDNNANGNGAGADIGIPSVYQEFQANGGNPTLYQDSWPTYMAAVTPGWNTMEIYCRRPRGGRSDITTGRFWARVTPDGTQTPIQICDFVGGIQAGLENLPWNRIGISNLYSNGNVPNGVSVGATEIWSTYPGR